MGWESLVRDPDFQKLSSEQQREALTRTKAPSKFVDEFLGAEETQTRIAKNNAAAKKAEGAADREIAKIGAPPTPSATGFLKSGGFEGGFPSLKQMGQDILNAPETLTKAAFGPNAHILPNKEVETKARKERVAEEAKNAPPPGSPTFEPPMDIVSSLIYMLSPEAHKKLSEPIPGGNPEAGSPLAALTNLPFGITGKVQQAAMSNFEPAGGHGVDVLGRQQPGVETIDTTNEQRLPGDSVPSAPKAENKPAAAAGATDAPVAEKVGTGIGGALRKMVDYTKEHKGEMAGTALGGVVGGAAGSLIGQPLGMGSLGAWSGRALGRKLGGTGGKVIDIENKPVAAAGAPDAAVPTTVGGRTRRVAGVEVAEVPVEKATVAPLSATGVPEQAMIPDVRVGLPEPPPAPVEPPPATTTGTVPAPLEQMVAPELRQGVSSSMQPQTMSVPAPRPAVEPALQNLLPPGGVIVPEQAPPVAEAPPSAPPVGRVIDIPALERQFAEQQAAQTAPISLADLVAAAQAATAPPAPPVEAAPVVPEPAPPVVAAAPPAVAPAEHAPDIAQTRTTAMNLLDRLEQMKQEIIAANAPPAAPAVPEPVRPANVEPEIPAEMARQKALAEKAKTKQAARESQPGYAEAKQKLQAGAAYKEAFDKMVADGFPEKTARAAGYKAQEAADKAAANVKAGQGVEGQLEASVVPEKAPEAPVAAPAAPTAPAEAPAARPAAPVVSKPLERQGTTPGVIEPGRVYKVGDQLPNGKYVVEVDEAGKISEISKNPPAKSQATLGFEETKPLERKRQTSMTPPDQFPTLDEWWNHQKNLGFSEEEIAGALQEHVTGKAQDEGALFKKRPGGESKQALDILKEEPREPNSHTLEQVRGELKGEDITDLPEEQQVSILVKRMLPELKHQQKQVRSGEGWYKADIDAMEHALKNVEPTLHDSQDMLIMKMIAAATSFGNEPNPNIESALTIYKNFVETGKLPEKQDTGKNWPGKPTFALNARKLMQMSDALGGMRNVAKWMSEQHPVSELRQFNKDGIEGKASDMKYGSYVFGPKGGPFFQNLIGNLDLTTGDRWDNRAMHRLMGTEISDQATPTQRAVFNKASELAAQKLGVKPADAQGMRWFFEKSLYENMGVKKASFGTYSAAGRRAAEGSKLKGGAVVFKSPLEESTQSIATEVKFGTNSPYSQKYDWSSLSPKEARTVTQAHGQYLVDAIEASTGATVERADIGKGVYGSDANPNWIVKMRGTPEQLESAANMFGLGSQQDSVVASRETEAGKGSVGLEVSSKTQGQDWGKPDFIEKVWEAYSKAAPDLAENAGASLEFGDKGISIRMFNDGFADKGTLTRAAAAIEDAIRAVDQKSTPKVEAKEFETNWTSHGWGDDPSGKSYREVLQKNGYSPAEIDAFVKASDKSIDNAWQKATKGRKPAGGETLSKLTPVGEVELASSNGEPLKVKAYESGVPEFVITKTVNKNGKLTLTHKPTGYALVSDIPNTEGNQARMSELAKKIAEITPVAALQSDMKGLTKQQMMQIGDAVAEFRRQFSPKNPGRAIGRIMRDSNADIANAYREFAVERKQMAHTKSGDEMRAEASNDPVGYAIDNTVNYLFDNMQRVAEKTKIGEHFGKRTPALEAYQGKYIKKKHSTGTTSGARKPVWHGSGEGQLYVMRTGNVREAADRLAKFDPKEAKRILRSAADGGPELETLKNQYKKTLQDTIAHEMLHSFRDTHDSTQGMQNAMNFSGLQLLDTKTESGKTLREELNQYWEAKSAQRGFMDEVQNLATDAIDALESNAKGKTKIMLHKEAPRSEGPRPVQASLGKALTAIQNQRGARKPVRGVLEGKTDMKPRLAPKEESLKKEIPSGASQVTLEDVFKGVRGEHGSRMPLSAKGNVAKGSQASKLIGRMKQEARTGPLSKFIKE